jgi:predicted branched-subunit amino acid permease
VTLPADRPDTSPPWRWALAGTREIASLPAILMLGSVFGFGVLCRESGVSFGQAVFATATIYALPSQVVLVGAIAGGASLPAAAIGVALSAVRLAPLAASFAPMLGPPRPSRAKLLLLSHFLAITAWIIAALRLPKLPEAARLPYFAGFALTLTTAATLVTAVSYVFAEAMPPVVAGLLFFLTPIYFATALTNAARHAAERAALALGLVLGPLFRWLDAPLDLVWAGLLGGLLAWLAGRAFARAR